MKAYLKLLPLTLRSEQMEFIVTYTYTAFFQPQETITTETSY
jgi:hypothetical protein